MEKEIVDHLLNKYQPRFIILHGSRVDGMHRPQSDWDIALSSTTPAAHCVTEIFQGQSLDVENLGVDLDPKEFILKKGPIFQRARVIHDEAGTPGAAFLTEVQNILAMGRHLSSVEENNRFLRMSRVLDKMLGSLDAPELFFLHSGTLYELALRFWFEFRHEWSQAPYVAVKRIRLEDPGYYSLLQKLFERNSRTEALKASYQIYKIIFPERHSSHPSFKELNTL
jgi:hypothetical protein